ncbi:MULTISPECIES: ParM/StbA family protein [Clostridium]|uniref:ATPase n=2 Tax=Clostridium TaxID=1485 RepID=A0AA40IRH7_CLONO|nr:MULTISPECIES: ParM/StbA family protein [Clostridium]KEI08187.1 putative ATPase [Clostridium novyi B str. NCTC 9691]KEI11454.1 putative ATPase [Clostridium novyi B str. ATCC 27606]KEI18298.1 hypothetical protein Z960_04100 [Clostridium haemolyticum NCTC 9693]KGN01172.1 hypothetical protein Z961_09680 [Clostridium haemolyticum NCTC 8350]
MNIGIDVGNGYTKLPVGKFASRVKIGERVGFGKHKKEVHYVKYNDINYIIGQGAPFTGDERYFSEYYKVCLLTSIALSENNEDFIDANVVVGVPEKKYKLIGDKLKKHIIGYGQQQITVNDKEYTIRITDCIVFIEAAYPILTEDESNVIVIDNGAGTINVTQWEELSILNSATYNESMYKMYADISSYLNLNKGSDYKPTDIEKLLNKKTAIINNVETDITDIRPIVENHITEIASFIKNDFKVKNASKIYLIGGGGADTINYWKKHFPVIELVPESQSINQKVYQTVADNEFGEDDE